MVRKAVIPAAGFGTRFLPASKSVPKEMLPIIDTPVIQYVVEEAVASGITDIVLVISRSKRAIEEHFDRNTELEQALDGKGRKADLEQIRRISEMADIHFVWQKEMKGLGDAVACARHHVGNEPFALLLGDTILSSPRPVTRQLVELHERFGETVVALQEIDRAHVSRYGIMAGDDMGNGLYRVKDFVEKPDPAKAPSTLAFAGRYVLAPGIMECLANTPRGKNDEIQLTDAMRLHLKSRAAYGLRFEGCRHDVGNKLDFIRTNVTFALQREDMKADVAAFLREQVARLDREQPR